MTIKKRPIKPKGLRGADGDLFKQAEKPLQSIAAKTITLTVPLDKLFERALANDMEEIVVRISQYGPELQPETFQAIVRFSDARRPWAVAVEKTAHIAFIQALTLACDMPGPTFQQRAKPNGASKDAAGILRKRPKPRIK